MADNQNDQHDKAFAEAERRIDEVLTTGATALDLAKLGLTALPEAIGRLTALKWLYVSENQLTALPESLKHVTSLQKLFLHGNEALNLPEEVLGPGRVDVLTAGKAAAAPAAILDYYFRARASGRPLNEAKLILVGFGEVGKTSLVKRLIDDTFDPKEKQTEGIRIREWPLRLDGGDDVRLHVWDFGGQEIMHATHQFFMTERSLYLLVLNGRQGREEADADYWLALIDSFAAASPVIIVLNKITPHPCSIDRSGLRRRFPNIVDVVRTDCADRTGLDDLAALIRRETDGLEDLRTPFPGEWFAIKDALAAMPDNYLTMDRYRAMCVHHGETDRIAQDRLAGFLHSLGVALNYKDDPRLLDTNVLNPRWVTEGIYRILNDKQIAAQKGEVALADIAQVLDPADYPPERHLFLIELMRKFELCVPFHDDRDRYLIPELLDKDQPPEAEAFSPDACLNFDYRYPTLPEGLLPRFIVRTHVLGTGQARWRTGAILAFESARALVMGEPLAKRIHIAVEGPLDARRRLLAVIRSDFERIHVDYTFAPEQLVPVPGHPDVAVPYEDLVVMEREKEEFYPVVANGRLLKLDVKALLNGVDLEGTRRSEKAPEKSMPGIRAFVSYSHKDDALREELQTHIKLFLRQGKLDAWDDRRITPGDEWKGQIDNNLENAELVLLLVSADFIASDYCYDIEMKRALERHKEGTARVIPIIIRDCAWQSAPFGKVNALPTDGHPVTHPTHWGNGAYARDTAWKSVADGIAKVLDAIAAPRRGT